MMRIICFIFGHRPRIQWYWQSYKGWKPSGKNRTMGVVTCTRCNLEFGGPSNPPR